MKIRSCVIIEEKRKDDGKLCYRSSVDAKVDKLLQTADCVVKRCVRGGWESVYLVGSIMLKRVQKLCESETTPRRS